MSTTRTATPADDEPFDFDLNTVQAESDLRPFRFRWAAPKDPNRRLTMTHMEGLDVWPLAAAADNGDAAAMLGIFETALGEDWEPFRDTPLPQFKLKALFKAYQKHCGQKPGESQASPNS